MLLCPDSMQLGALLAQMLLMYSQGLQVCPLTSVHAIMSMQMLPRRELQPSQVETHFSMCSQLAANTCYVASVFCNKSVMHRRQQNSCPSVLIRQDEGVAACTVAC